MRDLTIREDEVIPSQETCVPVFDNTLRAKFLCSSTEHNFFFALSNVTQFAYWSDRWPYWQNTCRHFRNRSNFSLYRIFQFGITWYFECQLSQFKNESNKTMFYVVLDWYLWRWQRMPKHVAVDNNRCVCDLPICVSCWSHCFVKLKYTVTRITKLTQFRGNDRSPRSR